MQQKWYQSWLSSKKRMHLRNICCTDCNWTAVSRLYIMGLNLKTDLHYMCCTALIVFGKGESGIQLSTSKMKFDKTMPVMTEPAFINLYCWVIYAAFVVWIHGFVISFWRCHDFDYFFDYVSLHTSCMFWTTSCERFPITEEYMVIPKRWLIYKVFWSENFVAALKVYWLNNMMT